MTKPPCRCALCRRHARFERIASKLPPRDAKAVLRLSKHANALEIELADYPPRGVVIFERN